MDAFTPSALIACEIVSRLVAAAGGRKIQRPAIKGVCADVKTKASFPFPAQAGPLGQSALPPAALAPAVRIRAAPASGPMSLDDKTVRGTCWPEGPQCLTLENSVSDRVLGSSFPRDAGERQQGFLGDVCVREPTNTPTSLGAHLSAHLCGRAAKLQFTNGP